MKPGKYYDKEFYAELNEGSYLSARKVLPIVNEIFFPQSVIDVGCGVGYWLKVWKDDFMIDDILGVEGGYVREIFQLENQFLKIADLNLPLQLDRKFDLVMSMEVAEHIPENCADVFIESLVQLGDIILFSAAIKGQLGTHHLNEQMPEYWATKFLKHNYLPVDYIRPIIWNDIGIQYWYRQNTLLFIKKSKLEEYPQIRFSAEATRPEFLLRIHPEKYFAYVDESNQLKTLYGFVKYKMWRLKKWIKHRK